jgi:hypothetical protein
LYDYIIKLNTTQAEIITNHVIPNARGMDKDKPGDQAYESSVDSNTEAVNSS